MRALVTWITLSVVLSVPRIASSQDLLVPMDNSQTDHLKAYGIVYWALERTVEVDWLLNYRGGSFLMPSSGEVISELRVRGVSYESLSASAAARTMAEVQSEDANTSVVRLEKPPEIAVYAPDQTLPWDDAVLLALTYAEVPYEMIYDEEVLAGDLGRYDWLHLHHEDFTGQYGKFFNYRSTAWYIEQQREAELAARRAGFRKVPDMKAAVAEEIKAYVGEGGFLFAMCSGTDTFDIALAASGTDIVPAEYDNDPIDPDALSNLDFSKTLAFENFRPIFNAREYEHSNIDSGPPPPQLRNPAVDYFTLFEFSAKYDPVPTMLTQNHVATIKGFIGQTTNFRKSVIKPNVVILAEAPGRDEVRYLNGTYGQGTFTFYGGHDPEDYQHFVGEEPTDLSLHKHSPGYRLILNNILFPAAKKKKQKT
ncbi:MAG: asparagine synthetase B [Bacteroidetes bacterium CG12_big_fil_rev_8_21_14_0_65_60_17]|nr:MAG: asparagine synthetase B [Bacteroidetes bacterium CG12_big_fil_rev_8_21_14_0_65_60_17]